MSVIGKKNFETVVENICVVIALFHWKFKRIWEPVQYGLFENDKFFILDKVIRLRKLLKSTVVSTNKPYTKV